MNNDGKEVLPDLESTQAAWDAFSDAVSYDRLEIAFNALTSRRRRYFRDNVHVRTYEGSICVGSSENSSNVRADRTANMEVMPSENGLTITLSDLRDEKGRSFRTGFVRFHDQQVIKTAIERKYTGLVLNVSQNGDMALSGLFDGVEVEIPGVVDQDASTLLVGCLQALEKRSRT